MKKIQTKLIALNVVAVLCVAVFAGVVIAAAWDEFTSLSNFQRTSQISQTAYDLARSLTDERQAGYYASAFLGEGSPADQLANYQAKVRGSEEHLSRLRTLAATGQEKSSRRFREGLTHAIEAEGPLNELRREILDPARPQVQDINSNLKTKTLAVYDVALAAQAGFLPVLCLETQDAELVRRIVTQDNVARLQKDLWKVRGLVATALRTDKMTDTSNAEIKLKLLAIDDHVSRLKSLSDPETAAAVERLLGDTDYLQVTGLAAKLRDLGSKAAGFKEFGDLASYQSGPSVRLEKTFSEFSTGATRGIQAYTAERLAQARTRLWWLAGLCAFSVVGLSLLMHHISRSITRPLRAVNERLDQSGELTRNGSHLIAESAGRLSRDACDQAAALEQINSSIQQLSGVTSANVGHLKKLSQLANQSAAATRQGQQYVGQLTDAMGGIQKSTSDVATILKTIDGIAFQTNILALNAAVEAARAGEAGAGFSVVAEEVRALAQRSAEAARETATKIEAAVRNSQQGTELSRQTEAQFKEISRITNDHHEIIRAVEATSQQGTDGVAQVNQAIARVDEITQRTAATAEENAAAATEMADQVENMFAAVAQLDAMLHAGQATVAEAEANHGVPQSNVRPHRPTTVEAAAIESRSQHDLTLS
ncbi:MAG TPA: methyl-accepting chemotaxis protein [Lacunisphaera sp.]|nr:methyl-accepting chemotaxis protein [Lacunisphaera sp.]